MAAGAGSGELHGVVEAGARYREPVRVSLGPWQNGMYNHCKDLGGSLLEGTSGWLVSTGNQKETPCRGGANPKKGQAPFSLGMVLDSENYLNSPGAHPTPSS